MNAGEPLAVHVQGAGKAGRALASAIRDYGWPITLRPARRGPPKKVSADVIVFAVRDGQIAEEAQRWLEAGIIPTSAAVLHMAGALEPDILSCLRGVCRGVGQMHPLVSMVRKGKLQGAFALVSGDTVARRRAVRVAKAAGMTAFRGDSIDRASYHAAAWLVAGGTAALCSAARDLLMSTGIEERKAERMLAVLIRSVSANVERWGLPEALTGVVRRGDLPTLKKHVQVLKERTPTHLGLYVASARAQLAMVEPLQELQPALWNEFDAELLALDRELAQETTTMEKGE